MKTTKSLVLMSAVALIGSAGFTACSSSDDVAVNNPRYNPETNEINANFIFNVSTGNTTRQSAAATQATEDERFRGIDNAVLFSYKQAGKDGKHLAALPDGGKMDKRYDLSEILAPNTIDKDNSLTHCCFMARQLKGQPHPPMWQKDSPLTTCMAIWTTTPLLSEKIYRQPISNWVAE